MYASVNFKTKKAFKEAVAKGQQITLWTPGLGKPTQDGQEFVEGPHFPAPHTWYASVKMEGGIVKSVK